MASANLDLVRSLYAAWGRGDFSSAEWADSAIQFVIIDGPSPGSWNGRAGMAEGWRDWMSAWAKVRIEVDEYRELDRDRVLVLARASGRGKISGLEVGQLRSESANLFEIRDDKVMRLVIYWDRERAFADLGLTPESGSPRT